MDIGAELLSLFVTLLLAAGATVVAIVLGLVTVWVDRKVTARVQMRVGPPFRQPFYDIAKYCIKDTCVPAASVRWLFLAAPLVGFAGAAVAAAILLRALLAGEAVTGDLIVVLYLLLLPALSVILGAISSRNPIAALGGSREMTLLFSYELPLLLAVLVPVVQAFVGAPELFVQGQRNLAAQLDLAALLDSPAAVTRPSGVLALAVGVLCMQAKLTLVPFDIPEAETELTGGAYIEYSGPPLAVYKLTRAMMMFVLPTFLITVFCGGLSFHGLGFVLWYLVLVTLAVLLKNTAPRLRIDQALKFFWGPVALTALLAVALAYLGW